MENILCFYGAQRRRRDATTTLHTKTTVLVLKLILPIRARHVIILAANVHSSKFCVSVHCIGAQYMKIERRYMLDINACTLWLHIHEGAPHLLTSFGHIMVHSHIYAHMRVYSHSRHAQGKRRRLFAKGKSDMSMHMLVVPTNIMYRHTSIVMYSCSNESLLPCFRLFISVVGSDHC